MTKTERLHRIVGILRTRRRITRTELQEETGVSRATLMRDLAWLRDELNHPIHWDREAQCYLWHDSTNTNDSYPPLVSCVVIWDIGPLDLEIRQADFFLIVCGLVSWQRAHD